MAKVSTVKVEVYKVQNLKSKAIFDITEKEFEFLKSKGFIKKYKVLQTPKPTKAAEQEVKDHIEKNS